jgi:hypothetical protein
MRKWSLREHTHRRYHRASRVLIFTILRVPMEQVALEMVISVYATLEVSDSSTNKYSVIVDVYFCQLRMESTLDGCHIYYRVTCECKIPLYIDNKAMKY